MVAGGVIVRIVCFIQDDSLFAKWISAQGDEGAQGTRGVLSRRANRIQLHEAGEELLQECRHGPGQHSRLLRGLLLLRNFS
ncbi:hypothetical protein OESDEN_18856 [Oesophagostomum dentatum]|uniref:Uncharacterized protein n=1 Tax=Oesophagostomum dentatum TaxID=61180 RepID=A0A0B1S814_OESDE|nr:hypothetical protein OESDEN_18856 [Oesophagostomum dentatum]